MTYKKWEFSAMNLVIKSKYNKIIFINMVVLFLGIQAAYSQSEQLLQTLQNFSRSNDSDFNSFDTFENSAIQNPLINPIDSHLQEEFLRFQEFYNQKQIKEKLRRTELEKSYSKRSGKNLNLQGYEIFIRDKFSLEPNYNSASLGAIGDNYVLGPGDEVYIYLQGGINKSYRQKVSRDGNLYLEFSPPLPVYGKNYKQLKLDIEKIVQNTFLETEAYVTIGAVRNIQIIVSGQVRYPGNYKIAGLSSINEAIIKAGGIKKDGSLRKIKITQNNEVYYYDYYDLIFGLGNPKTLNLNDGAVISIPSIGETVALTGNISRPGIYEILGEETNLDDVLHIAGGYSGPYNQKLSIQRVNENISFVEKSTLIQNGDIIIATQKLSNKNETVEIFGSALNTGVFPIGQNKKLSYLLPTLNSLEKNAYTFAILIKTQNNNTLDYEFNIINLWDIFKGKSDYLLKNLDEIFVFSWQDLEFINSPWVLEAFNPSQNKSSSSCEAVRRLSQRILAKGSSGDTAYYGIISALQTMQLKKSLWEVDELKNQNDLVLNKIQKENDDISQNENINKLKRTCPKIFLDNPEILAELIDYLYIFRGEIKKPGIYLGELNSNNKSLLNYVGVEDKNLSISPDGKIIDVISNVVKVQGSVRFPVNIKFQEGISLSKILKKNSFLKKSMYPFFGLINRINKDTGLSYYVTFNLQNILSSKTDINLFPDDTITIFDKEEILKITDFIENLNKNHIPVKSDLSSQSIANNKYDNSSNIDIEKENEILEILKNNSESSNSMVLSSILNVNELDEKLEEYKNNLNDGNQKVNEKQLVSETGSNFQKENPLKNSTNYNSSLINLINVKSVLIKGEIVKPGIYPIGGETKTSELIEFAGGLKSNASLDHIEVSNPLNSNIEKGNVGPGGSILILPRNLNKEKIFYSGAVLKPREISFSKNLSLADILSSSKSLNEEAYLYFATIERLPSSLSSKKFFAFSPSSVILGKQNILMKPGDKIKIYTEKEIDKLIELYLKNNPENYRSTIKFDGLDTTGSIEELVKRHYLVIDGQVSRPGKFLIADLYQVSKIIDIAGGFTQLANKANISLFHTKLTENGSFEYVEEKINLQNNKLKKEKIYPGSFLKVAALENNFEYGTANIEGSIWQPGSYRIKRGDSIFDLIKKSGGLKENAYVKGLVFSREEEQLREKKSILRLQRELDKGIISALETTTKSGLDPTSIVALKELSKAAADYTPLGRVVGDFDNIKVLKNIYIKNGDKIYIPKKPTSVSVVGEVMTPGSILWNSKNDVTDYLDSSAGLTDQADKKKIFVILPNGQAKRLNGLWSGSVEILAGSTIVIPRKIRLASSVERASSISSVIYQITLSLAGIDSILD